MTPDSHGHGRRSRRDTGRRPCCAALVAAVAGLVTGTLVLGGCAALRLETPPPATPSPDAVERVRDRTARDAVEIAELATQAALTAPEGVATLLGRVAEVSLAHAEALGGVYEPFPGATPGATSAADPTPDVGAGATVAPNPTPAPADASDVLAVLGAAAATVRTDADTVADGDLARLLASVWASRTLLAEALDAAAVAAGSAPDPAVPPVAVAPVPGELPSGPDLEDVLTLVRSEDATGMAWEVVAARSADPGRTEAAARASLHRGRADAWAVTAGVARGAQDPRRAAYDLPETLTVDGATPEAMAAVTAELETSLGVDYAAVVARTDAGARGPLLAVMLDQLRRGLSAGAPVPAFPGLPERA